MPIPNPEYKENWEELHDHSDAERTRLQTEISDLSAQGESDSIYQRVTELQETRDKHDEICKRCLDTYQHKTVQDAAKWLFNFCPPGLNADHRGSKVVHEIDFEQFETVDAVWEAWREADRISKEVAHETASGGPIFH